MKMEKQSYSFKVRIRITIHIFPLRRRKPIEEIRYYSRKKESSEKKGELGRRKETENCTRHSRKAQRD